MEAQQKNEHMQNKMGTMPVSRLLITMSLPMILSMFIQALYNIVDSIFVAQISENALTAVSLSFPIQMLMIAVSVGTGVGINSLISRRLGEKRFEEANAAASNGLFLLVVSAIVFMLFGFFGSRVFFTFFTEDADIIQKGADYLSICTIFCIGIFMQIGSERIIQATGNTVQPMLVQLLGAIINIVLDPILIFGYLGFPAMGIKGAAIATVAGQIIAMFFGLYLLFFKKHDVAVRFKGFRPNGPIIRDIYAVGVPSIIMQSIGSVMNFGMNKILVAFSPVAVNVFGVYFKLNSFVFMPVFGLNNGAMSILGYNFGARNRKRMMATWRLGFLLGFAIMMVGVLIFNLFPEFLLKMFEASPEMLELGVPALRIISYSFPVAALGIICSTMFQAVGKGFYSLLMSLLRQLVVILPAAYLFSVFYGVKAVWWAFPLSEIVSLLFCFLVFRRVYIKMIKPLDEPLETVKE